MPGLGNMHTSIINPTCKCTENILHKHIEKMYSSAENNEPQEEIC